MPSTARLTNALRGRRNAVALAGAVAALAGVGSASAAAPAEAHTTAAVHRTAAQKPAVAHHAAVKQPAVAHRGPARHAPATHAVARHAAPARPKGPYQIYDSVTPSAIPGHHVIATYSNGGFAVSPSQVAGKKVLWIDTNGSNPRANALDVEPGDATPSQAGMWAANKLKAQPNSRAILYTMLSEWPAVKASVSSLPHWMQSHVRYWIADPTGAPHIVPGASATQWYWGKSFDITSAKQSF
jgi:hypothetical protein